MTKRYLRVMLAVAIIMMVTACSTTRHVADGSMLLDRVNIIVDRDSAGHQTVTSSDLFNYLRQQPNHKVLGFWKLQLATYNLSGRNSTKWYNKWLRKMGQAPVIFDESLAEASERQLELALINRGYLGADVTTTINPRPDKKKATVTYHVSPGEPHRIASIAYDIEDETIRGLLLGDSTRVMSVATGNLLNRDLLDDERTLLTTFLRNRGYYSFTKENISYLADTVAGSKDVALTMVIRGYHPNDTTTAQDHPVYRIGEVTFVANGAPGRTLQDCLSEADTTVHAKGMNFVFGEDRWINPNTLEEKTFIQPGGVYSAREIDNTYEYLSRLEMIRSVNIEIVPSDTSNHVLDAYIILSRNKKQGITFEVEGTNSEGDLGFGVSLTYRHRNLGHRSRVLTTKFRASYESISGNLEGLINNNFQEYSAEVGLTFPKFAFPFVSGALRKRLKASTEVAVNFNYQARPEYTRIMTGGTWKYKWSSPRGLTRHTLDLLSINYVYLPKWTFDFLEEIGDTNPLLKYSYEDHFIMNIGYSYYKTNRRPSIAGMRTNMLRNRQPLIYTFRIGAETAGNLLYGISKMIGQKKSDGVYKIFGIQYSQYAKAEIEYSIVRNINERHSLAFRVGGGIGIPYGNSEALPFEKRFYGGGANGVRGWGVRTLGPGSFDGKNSVSDFINQCGDISMIFSAEYRAKLFWVLEGALFFDAGNIWTIRDYPNQPGGLFKFNEFYKQLAASYGIGLRFDFTYFLLRLDLGMKAHNPASGQEPWPIIHPHWKRDATFHFAVGYPF